MSSQTHGTPLKRAKVSPSFTTTPISFTTRPHPIIKTEASFLSKRKSISRSDPLAQRSFLHPKPKGIFCAFCIENQGFVDLTTSEQKLDDKKDWSVEIPDDDELEAWSLRQKTLRRSVSDDGEFFDSDETDEFEEELTRKPKNSSPDFAELANGFISLEDLENFEEWVALCDRNSVGLEDTPPMPLNG